MINKIYKSVFILILLLFSSCEDHLNELNDNPNGVAPGDANPNLLMPTVMVGAALNTLQLGYQDIAGVVQHTQKDGWYSGHNHYDWGLQDWTGWYDLLRTNEFLHSRAGELEMDFHQGVALTMRSYIFGMITDLWGDAPYTMALQGHEPGQEFEFPAFDSQEVIYAGIIEDLNAASEIFSRGDDSGVFPEYDVYYNGDVQMWHKFANSLLLRYYMRISSKMPDIAKAGIENIYNSGVYIQNANEDATMDFIGATGADSWPTATAFDAGSNFRRLKPAQTLIDRLLNYNDPRLNVWVAPVHVQWVADPTLDVAVDPFIRRDGEIQEGVVSLTDEEYVELKASGHEFTRHFNPDLFHIELDTNQYVGVPAGLLQPDSYNFNPTEGQQLENQHVSQLSHIYRQQSGDLLKARIISAAEVHFILAEAALKGWAVGDAEAHYNAGIQNSLATWGVADQFSNYILEEGVAFEGTLEQIMEQKWIASWTNATEAWFDFRRTGFPALTPGPASPEPVLPVRFNYGNNEINFNAANVQQAIDRLEVTPYEGNRGRNNPWSKPWIIQGTGAPW